MPDDQWEELTTYLDVNDDSELTFRGFISLYSLQTGASRSRLAKLRSVSERRLMTRLLGRARAENDEAETNKDLEHWGYDPKTLELVSSSTTEEEKVEEKAE